MKGKASELGDGGLKSVAALGFVALGFVALGLIARSPESEVD